MDLKSCKTIRLLACVGLGWGLQGSAFGQDEPLDAQPLEEQPQDVAVDPDQPVLAEATSSATSFRPTALIIRISRRSTRSSIPPSRSA